MQSPSLLTLDFAGRPLAASEGRSHAACGLVAGAAAGALTGALDALLSGADAAGLVAAYLAAVGLVVGGLTGLCTGWLTSVALRRPARPAARGAGGVERASRAVAVGVAVAVFAVVIIPVTTLFGSAFRNRELAALTLAVAVLGLWLGAFFAGGAAAGLAERWLARLAADRRARAVRILPYAMLVFAGLVLLALGVRARAHLALGDLRAGSLLLVYVCGTLALRRLLFARAFRLAALPWALRRAALVTLVVCGYATFQLLTGGAPRVVAAARPLVSLGSVVIPASDEVLAAGTVAAGAGGPRTGAGAGLAKGSQTTKALSEKGGSLNKGDLSRKVASRTSAGASSAEGRDSTGAQAGPAAGLAAEATARATPAPSVLLITLDSVRADHLPTYGYARPTMSKLDAYSKRCLVFERAYAASSAERDGVAALLTGRLPSQLQRSPGAWPRLLRGNRPLAEVLRSAGYHTAAVVSHDAHGAESGLGRGFTTFDTSPARRGERATLSTATSPLVADKAKALLAAAPKDKPFFLWAHFADPHGAYVAHPSHDLGRKKGDRYDGELAFTDEHLGALLAEADGAGRPLWIIVTADHGEALGERGRSGHGGTLNESEVRVPLLVCAAGVEARRAESPVSVLDLYPTLLEAAGLPVPKGLPGRSLAPALRGEARFVRGPVPLEIAPLAGRLGAAALIDGMDKLSLLGAGNHPRLFELRSDPEERQNRALREPQRVRKLQIALLQLRVPALGEPRAVRTRTGAQKTRGFIQATEDAAEQEALERARKRKEALRGKP